MCRNQTTSRGCRHIPMDVLRKGCCACRLLQALNDLTADDGGEGSRLGAGTSMMSPTSTI